jgi:hypothetical protein
MAKHARRLGTTGFVAIALAGVLASSPVRATHDEPGRGKALKTTLVTAYDACTSPNTTTSGGLPQPACSPPVRSDSVCGFGALYGRYGMAKAKGIARDGDIELSVTASGLGNGCEGQTLCGVVIVRVTTDRCANGMSPCTTSDIELTNTSETACCRVFNGNCKLKTTINTEVFDAIRAGERAGVQVLGCGLRRISGTSLPTGLTLTCGMLAP